jgi:hypothetical protein
MPCGSYLIIVRGFAGGAGGGVGRLAAGAEELVACVGVALADALGSAGA